MYNGKSFFPLKKACVDVHYLQETTLMIHTPLTLTKEAGAGHGDYQLHNNQYQVNILGGKYRIDHFYFLP